MDQIIRPSSACFLTEPNAKEIISPKWEVIKREAIIIKHHPSKTFLKAKVITKAPLQGNEIISFFFFFLRCILFILEREGVLESRGKGRRREGERIS